MSRYCGETETKAILSAAEYWKSAALLHSGSVFSNEHLWISENLDSLNRYFVCKDFPCESSCIDWGGPVEGGMAVVR